MFGSAVSRSITHGSCEICVRHKHLQDENGRLKKLVAELTLDRAMLQDVLLRLPRADVWSLDFVTDQLT